MFIRPLIYSLESQGYLMAGEAFPQDSNEYPEPCLVALDYKNLQIIF